MGGGRQCCMMELGGLLWHSLAHWSAAPLCRPCRCYPQLPAPCLRSVLWPAPCPAGFCWGRTQTRQWRPASRRRPPSGSATSPAGQVRLAGGSGGEGGAGSTRQAPPLPFLAPLPQPARAGRGAEQGAALSALCAGCPFTPCTLAPVCRALTCPPARRPPPAAACSAAHLPAQPAELLAPAPGGPVWVPGRGRGAAGVAPLRCERAELRGGHPAAPGRVRGGGAGGRARAWARLPCVWMRRNGTQ